MYNVNVIKKPQASSYHLSYTLKTIITKTVIDIKNITKANKLKYVYLYLCVKIATNTSTT